MPTIHLIIRGKVQGVFFRAGAKEAADRLRLTGWVRNTEEGYVECNVTGEDDQLEDFISWCRKGPSRAVVTDVQVTGLPLQSFRQFSILR